MKDTHQNRVAGVGTAIGAVIFGAFMASCAPGKLPCDKDDQWRAVCEDEAETAQGGSGGGGGGQGGAPGSGGGPAAGSGGGGGGPITAETTIDCAAFPTLGAMDMFFANRCGVNATCHAMGSPWSDFKTEKVFERMAGTKAKLSCAGANVIDKDNWSNSVMLAKTKSPVMCPPGGSSPGLIMPPPGLAPMMDPLTPAELACLENFVKKVAGM